MIEVEEECGGLPPYRAERLFRAFVQVGREPRASLYRFACQALIRCFSRVLILKRGDHEQTRKKLRLGIGAYTPQEGEYGFLP
jgi:hypothetical protein